MNDDNEEQKQQNQTSSLLIKSDQITMSKYNKNNYMEINKYITSRKTRYLNKNDEIYKIPKNIKHDMKVMNNIHPSLKLKNNNKCKMNINVNVVKIKQSIILITLAILCIFTNLCYCDVEPKPAYDDLTTTFSKSNFNDDLNSITKINVNNNNNINLNPNKLNNENLSDNNNHNTNNNDDENLKSSSKINDLGFIHAFIASISVILVSELGDKTFFIAAIMAMRHPRLTVFLGAMSALGLMTILSVVFGMAATIIPRVYTYYISTVLFAIFGLKMLKEGYYMSPTNGQEEIEELQSDINKRDDKLNKKDDSYRRRKRRSHLGSDDNTHKDDDDDDINDVYDHNLAESNSNHHDNIEDDVNGDNIIADSDDDHHKSHRISCNNINSSSCSRTGNQLQSVFKNSSSSSVENSDAEMSSPSAAASLNHGTIINNNNHKKFSTPISSTTKIIRSVSSNNCVNYNHHHRDNDGIELMQLNKGGCKNRLEKEVSMQLVQDPESGVIRKTKQRSAAYLASRIFMQAFTMTFLAEWGDRSQLTTIILSAREDIYGVITGGILGHSLCTGLAVVGGRIIAQKISVRTVTLVGGVVFILFAISALFLNPNAEP